MCAGEVCCAGCAAEGAVGGHCLFLAGPGVMDYSRMFRLGRRPAMSLYGCMCRLSLLRMLR